MGKYYGEAPVFQMLQSYAALNHASFHTPGHKGSDFNGDFFSIYKYDATEISFTDELYSPGGCISQGETLATELFHSYHTFFSTGGASQCVKAALAEFAGKKVIFDRNIHFSAAAAAAFYGIDAVFVWGKCDEKTSLPIPPTAEDFRKALDENPDAEAIFLTSPNYFGVAADCLSVRKFCDEKNLTFIADNSHGTHFSFCKKTKNASCDAHIAHVVIDSAHKTLPVMTGGAFLHYYKEISLSEVRRRMMAAGSTSPSFPILASLDYGRAICASEGLTLYSACCEKVENIKKTLKNHGFLVSDGENIDPLRLSVYLGENCAAAQEHLEKNGIYPEMSANGFLVFIITPFNEISQLELLEKTLLKLTPVEASGNFNLKVHVPQRKISIREAFFADREDVLPLDSAGRVSADMIAFHQPPCVPLAVPGEVISEELALLLHEKNYGKTAVVADK